MKRKINTKFSLMGILHQGYKTHEQKSSDQESGEPTSKGGDTMTQK